MIATALGLDYRKIEHLEQVDIFTNSDTGYYIGRNLEILPDKVFDIIGSDMNYCARCHDPVHPVGNVANDETWYMGRSYCQECYQWHVLNGDIPFGDVIVREMSISWVGDDMRFR